MRLRGAAAALLLAASPAFAAFEDLGSGARVPGMGNAFVAIADDVSAVHYNPAGLAQLENPELAAAYSKLYLGLSDGSDLGMSHLAYAQPLKAGRWGAAGAAWERLSLSGVYQEQTLNGSWGKQAWTGPGGGKLLAGVSLKYLQRSFSQLPEVYNAMDKNVPTGLPDPVLSGKTSKGVPDADIGLLYRWPAKYSAGLAVRHVARPNIAFGSAPERLPIDYHAGMGYHALWLNLTGELQLDHAPDGTIDRDFILGGERFFPTLTYGQFGVRGSMGIGSRDFRQATLGLSYRVNRIQMDYAFLMPIGGIGGTAGTHRMGMTFHFGGPTPEEELQANLVDQMRRLRAAGKGVDVYELEDVAKPRDLSEPTLEGVRREIEGGHYRNAFLMLKDLVKAQPNDAGIARLWKRLDIVAYYYPDYPEPKEAWEKALVGGALSLAQGKDSRAILHTSYALSLRPDDEQLSRYLARIEEITQVKALRLEPGSTRNFIQELFYRSEAAFNRGDYQRVLDFAHDILALEPDNATALSRAGSIYFLLKQYEKALAAWKKALELEKSPQEKSLLERYIAEVSRKLGILPAGNAPAAASVPAGPADNKPAGTAGVEKAAAPAGNKPGGTAGAEKAAAPAEEAEEAPEVVRPRAEKLPPPDSRMIERLYLEGVRHYARGETLQAAAIFMRILQLDPKNEAARKALERIKQSFSPLGRP